MNRALLSALVILALGCTACGGSNPDPVNRTESGALEDGDSVLEEDNSFYDAYDVEVGEGYVITATMRSDAFDTYLHIMDPSGTQVAYNDDDAAAGGTNSQIVFTAPSAGTYQIYANSLSGGETGAYTLEIVTAQGQ